MFYSEKVFLRRVLKRIGGGLSRRGFESLLENVTPKASARKLGTTTLLQKKNLVASAFSKMRRTNLFSCLSKMKRVSEIVRISTKLDILDQKLDKMSSLEQETLHFVKFLAALQFHKRVKTTCGRFCDASGPAAK